MFIREKIPSPSSSSQTSISDSMSDITTETVTDTSADDFERVDDLFNNAIIRDDPESIDVISNKSAYSVLKLTLLSTFLIKLIYIDQIQMTVCFQN